MFRRFFDKAVRLDDLTAVLNRERSASRFQLIPMFGDMLFRRWHVTLLIVGASIASALVKATAAGLVFVYISHLEQGGAVSIFSRQIQLTGSGAELVAASIVAALLVILSALADYGVRRAVIAEGMHYFRECVQNASAVLSRIPRYDHWDAINPGDPALKTIFIGDVRYASVAYSQLLATALPLSTFAFAILVIFYLSPVLGAISLGGLSLLAPFYGRLFDYGNQLQTQLTESGREHALNQAALVSSIVHNPLHDWNLKGNVNQWLSQTSTGDYLGLLARRQALSERASLVANAGAAIATGGFVFFIGQQLMTGNASFAGIATLLLVLRYLVAGFTGLVSRITSLHALMPLFGRYMALRMIYYRLTRDAASSEVKTEPGIGDDPPWRWIAVFSTVDLTRGNAIRLARRIDPELDPDEVAYISSHLSPYSWDWEQDLTGGMWTLPDSDEKLAADFPEFRSRREEFAALRTTIASENMSYKAVSTLSRGLRLLLAFATQLRRGRKLLVFRGDDWRSLAAGERREIRTAMAKRKGVLVYDSIDALVETKFLNRAYLFTADGLQLLSNGPPDQQVLENLRSKLNVPRKAEDPYETPEMMELLAGQ